MDTAQSKSRLLLVDGDPKSLRVLDVSLKKAGFDVTTATSGREAIALLEAAVPDLIISDTDLAEMDGFELCSQIKARPEWNKIPFLFVSGRKSIEDKIRGLELGVEDYLSKPIYIKEIGIRVRTALQRADRERMESRREGRTRFAGDLSDVGVVDLVQTIELNRKSGIIHIVNRDNRRGSIFFRDGKVIDAEVSRLSGANAVYRLFSWSEGQFAVEFKQIRRHDVVDTPMAPLLMEGMRRLDETTRLLEKLPSARAVLEVDCRVLAEQLAELPDEMNSLLRLCDGTRTLQEIVEDSDHPDLEALTIISKLFAGQIVFAREAPDRAGESEPGERLARWLSEGAVEDGLAAEDLSVSSEFPAPTGLREGEDVVPSGTPAPTPTLRLPAVTAAVEQADALADKRDGGAASADDALGAALPPAAQALNHESAATYSRRTPDTLKGVPVDSLFAERANPTVEASSFAAGDSSAPVAEKSAGPTVLTTTDHRPTKPLGLAERMLSEDSAVRASAIHEAISDGGGKIAGPLATDRNTREYGRPDDAAAALVEEVVSGAHEPKRERKQPAEPGRPSKEVDWGAWPTAQAERDGSTGQGVATTNTATAAQETRSDATPATTESAPSNNVAAEETTKTTRPLARVLAPAPGEPSDDGAAADAELEVPASSNKTSYRRLWLLAAGAFVVGAVGFILLFPRGPDPAPAAPGPSSAPSSDPSPVALPAQPKLPEGLPQPKEKAAPEAKTVAAEPPPPTGPSPARPDKPGFEKQPSAAAGPAKAPATSELHRKCLDADAGGKGKAKAVATACRPAVEADPTDVDAMVVLTRAELDRGRLIEAKSLAKKILTLNPERLEAYVYLGNAEQEAGKIDEARAAYKKYLELAPSGAFARELRAILSNL